MSAYITEMRLRKERRAAKLTQADLAQMSGVPQSSISRMERAEILTPTYETLDRLARALRRRGRKVQPGDLNPVRQPVLVKGVRNGSRRARATA